MNDDRLLAMANPIGAYFKSEADHGAAMRGVPAHPMNYWALPMRRAVLDAVDNNPDAAPTPLVAESLQAGRDMLFGKREPA